MFLKDPDSILDYTIDWSAWLEGDTIADSEWHCATDEPERVDSLNTPTTTTVWLSGGQLGKTYFVINRITTAGGRREDRTLSINIVER